MAHKNTEGGFMFVKPLGVVLLGVVFIAFVGISSYGVTAGVPPLKTPALPPFKHFKGFSKVFTGKDAVKQAAKFLAGKRLTLRIGLGSEKNVTFVGVALRPVGENTYVPAYLIVEGATPAQYRALKREFEEFARVHFSTKVSGVKVSSTIEPNVNWDYAGSIDWITSTTGSFFSGKGVLELKGFYYYYPIDANTIEYYAKTKIRGDVSSSDMALKDLRLRVSKEGAYEAIDDFLPDGHIGPTTSYSEAVAVELSSDSAAKISASAGYSLNTNDGYYFRMDTHTLNPNDYVEFHAYDFKKNVPLLPDPPAFGKSFFFESAVTIKVRSPGNACHFGIFKYDASAEFYSLTPAVIIPISMPPYLETSPKDIKLSVFVYPPHTVFHG